MSWWDHPDCVCVCLSHKLHNKGQHLGEATKIFLEYRILSIPVDKKVSVMTVWKLDSNKKSPLDVNLIVWGEAAMTHVWWPPFGSLFDFRKHNGDKAPEESWKLIHKTYPSKTLDPEHCESILNPVLFTPCQFVCGKIALSTFLTPFQFQFTNPVQI